MDIYRKIKKAPSIPALKVIYQELIPQFDELNAEITQLRNQIENKRSQIRAKKALLDGAGSKKNLLSAFEERLGELNIDQLESLE